MQAARGSMNNGLKANSLSFFESLVMGVAGSAPGYTIAVTTGVLLASAGALAPGALVIFAVPMLGIAFAYRALNKRAVSAGAAYQWTTAVFGKLLGFFSGWALLIAALVFMVTGSIPAATASLNFIDPALTGNVILTASVASLWFVVVALVLIMGIEITSKVQVVMTGIELIILTFVLIAAFVHVMQAGAVNVFSWSWFGFGYTRQSFAASALVTVFFYWGWDVTANLSEETVNAEDTAGNGGFSSVIVTIVYYLGFTIAALFLFSLKDAKSLTDNIIYNLAVASGLGTQGGLAASLAVILSSIATPGNHHAAILAHLVCDGPRRRLAAPVRPGLRQNAEPGARHVSADRDRPCAALGLQPDAQCQRHHHRVRQCGGDPGDLLLWPGGPGRRPGPFAASAG